MIPADSAPRNLPVPLLERYFLWAKFCYAFLWVVVEILAIRIILLSCVSAAIRAACSSGIVGGE